MKKNIIQIFNFISKNLQDVQIYKFISVGIVNTFLLICLTYIFMNFFHLYYLYSAIISYEITIIFGFIFNDLWTFSKNLKKSRFYVRFIKFQLLIRVKFRI